MTELEIAKLALEMIAYPSQQSGASAHEYRDFKYARQIAQIALLKMIHAKYARPEEISLFNEIGWFK